MSTDVKPLSWDDVNAARDLVVAAAVGWSVSRRRNSLIEPVMAEALAKAVDAYRLITDRVLDASLAASAGRAAESMGEQRAEADAKKVGAL